MRVLVACEFSGIVRDAFAALGHDAWSCDLLETERPGQQRALKAMPQHITRRELKRCTHALSRSSMRTV